MEKFADRNENYKKEYSSDEEDQEWLVESVKKTESNPNW